MNLCDWSSDVCSSDLAIACAVRVGAPPAVFTDSVSAAHNPAFAKAAAERLRAILAEDTPLTELVRRERLEWLLGTDESIAWYGQLMNVPQMMAFFVQLDYWLKRYNIRIV